MSFSLRRGEKCHLSCVMLLEVGVLAGDRGGVNSRGEGLAEFTLYWYMAYIHAWWG